MTFTKYLVSYCAQNWRKLLTKYAVKTPLLRQTTQDLSCYRKCKLRCLYRLSIGFGEHNLMAKTNLPDYLFSPEKVVSAIRKCRIILVTIYVTTDAVYRQQCNATKAYRPVGEETEDVQRRLKSSMLTKTLHTHQHQNQFNDSSSSAFGTLSRDTV